MYDKKGLIKLETSAKVHRKKKTEITFKQTDVGTSTLVFEITRNNRPLEINTRHVDATLLLTSGDIQNDDEAMYVYDKLDIRDPKKGIARYTIPDEMLSRTGRVNGQAYLLVKGKKDIITEVEFSFRVEKSLIGEIPKVEQFREIRTFADLRGNIMKQIEEIKQDAKSIKDIIENIKYERDNAIDDIKNEKTQSTNELDEHTETLKNDITEYKDNGINEIEERLKDQKSEINDNFGEQVSKFDEIKNEITDLIGQDGNIVLEEDTENWQKHKLTDDDGILSNKSLGSDLEELRKLDTGFHYSTGVPIDNHNVSSKAGFLTVIQNNSVKHILFRPYNSNRQFLMRYYKEWYDWEEVGITTSDTGWKDLTLKNGITHGSGTEKAQYRITEVDGITTVDLRGAVRGIKERRTVFAEIPIDIDMVAPHYYTQNTSFVNDTANFNRMAVKGGGELELEETTLSSEDMNRNIWFPIATTFKV